MKQRDPVALRNLVEALDPQDPHYEFLSSDLMARALSMEGKTEEARTYAKIGIDTCPSTWVRIATQFSASGRIENTYVTAAYQGLTLVHDEVVRLLLRAIPEVRTEPLLSSLQKNTVIHLHLKTVVKILQVSIRDLNARLLLPAEVHDACELIFRSNVHLGYLHSCVLAGCLLASNADPALISLSRIWMEAFMIRDFDPTPLLLQE